MAKNFFKKAAEFTARGAGTVSGFLLGKAVTKFDAGMNSLEAASKGNIGQFLVQAAEAGRVMVQKLDAKMGIPYAMTAKEEAALGKDAAPVAKTLFKKAATEAYTAARKPTVSRAAGPPKPQMA